MQHLVPVSRPAPAPAPAEGRSVGAAGAASLFRGGPCAKMAATKRVLYVGECRGPGALPRAAGAGVRRR